MQFVDDHDDMKCFNNSALPQVTLSLDALGSVVKYTSSSAGIRSYVAGISSDALQ